MTRLTATADVDELGGGRGRIRIGIAERFYRDNGVLADIVPTWADSGDGTRPHLVSAAPFLCTVTPEGSRRIHPTRDLSKYFELGRPFVRVGNQWQAVSYGPVQRTAGRLRWDNAQSALIVDHIGHALKLGILLKNGFVPNQGQIAFPVELVGLTRTGGQLFDNGVPVGKLRPPSVYDLDNPDDERPIDVTFPRLQGQNYVLLQLPDLTGMSQPLVDPTYSSQPDGTAGIDTTLQQASADTDRSTLTTIQFEIPNDGRNGLIKFDLSSIPGGATLSSSTLTLFTVTSRATARTMHVRQVLSANSSWVESSTWNYLTPSTVRWAGDSGGDGGADAGCGVQGTDYSNTSMGNFTIGISEAAGTQHDITLDLTETAAMIANNYGMWISTTESGNDVNVDSSDSATSGERPLLTIEYTETGSKPKSLLALGVG